MAEKTAEERAAFGARMAAARAAAKAARSSQGDTAMAEKTGKVYAGRDDVPAGVRPIGDRPAVLGRVVDAGAVAGLEQAPDTGFTASSAVVNESDSVIGGGAVASREFGGNIASNRVPGQGKAVPATGPNRVANASAVLFSDKKDDGGMPTQLKRSQGRSGPAEPTGLPCSCVTYSPRINPQTGEAILRLNPETGEKEPIMEQHGMASYERGQNPAITWCTVCGGERDGVARPQNALRATAAASALRDAGVTINTEGIAARAAEMLDPRLTDIEDTQRQNASLLQSILDKLNEK